MGGTGAVFFGGGGEMQEAGLIEFKNFQHEVNTA
jgi:hypothetical protein